MADNLQQRLNELVEPLVRSMGLELWGIELSFGGRSLVRIFVERVKSESTELRAEAEAAPDGEDGPQGLAQAQGVTVEQCAELSRLIGLSLEVEDIIPDAYILEVSSPGLDRVFFTENQLARAVGQVVDVTLVDTLEEFPGRRRFRGLLLESPLSGSGDLFRLKLEDAAFPGEEPPIVGFAFAGIKKARQVHVPPEKVKPGKGGRKNAKTTETRTK